MLSEMAHVVASWDPMTQIAAASGAMAAVSGVWQTTAHRRAGLTERVRAATENADRERARLDAHNAAMRIARQHAIEMADPPLDPDQYCAGCDRADAPSSQMRWTTDGLYRCQACRGLPTHARLLEQLNLLADAAGATPPAVQPGSLVDQVLRKEPGITTAQWEDSGS